jgi:hypothetical protein
MARYNSTAADSSARVSVRRPNAFQHRVEELARLLRVAVGQQLHGAFEVGKQHGDLLAFAFEGSFGGEDFLGQVRGRVGV